MTQIILASAAWYAVPKGIEYLISEPSSLESRVDRIRARLFTFKSALQGLNYPTRLKFAFKATSIIVSHMWLATLITPGLAKIIGFKDSYSYGFLKMAVCYALFSSRFILIKFINSNRGLDFIMSELGFKLASTEPVLCLINQHMRISHLGAQQELLDVLNRKLEYSAAQELFNAVPSNPPFPLFSITEKIKFWKLLEEKAIDSISFHLPQYRESIQDTDPILCKIQCSISGRAPRSVITDPIDRKTVYDRNTFETYLKCYDISPATREKIPEGFNLDNEGGSRYDSILRYRKTLLQSKELQNPEEFIANLKQIFEEICTLNDANDIKDASEVVCAFFQKGVLQAYDVSYFKTDPNTIETLLEKNKDYPYGVEHIKKGIKFHSYEIHRKQHNQDQYNDNMGYMPLRSKKGFIEVSLEDFEQYPFIVNELNLEIEKIKTEGQELIQVFS